MIALNKPVRGISEKILPEKVCKKMLLAIPEFILHLECCLSLKFHEFKCKHGLTFNL